MKQRLVVSNKLTKIKAESIEDYEADVSSVSPSSLALTKS